MRQVSDMTAAMCSPDGAKRNPGPVTRADSILPDCAEPVIGRAFARPVGSIRATLASIKLVKVMDRAVAMSDAEAICGGNRRADEGLGVAYGGLHVPALRQSRGNRRGERA